MKLIKPSFEIIEQEPGLDGIYKQIELAARLCYKSESNIKEGSAIKLVNALIKAGHGAMLEHGTVYLAIPVGHASPEKSIIKYSLNPYSRCVEQYPYYYIITNYRVLIENGWLDDLKYLCEPTEYHEKRHTVKFTTSIGITRELIRHRTFSFANESTRYCNYSSDKFNNEVTFIEPSWYGDKNIVYNIEFTSLLTKAEQHYLCMLKEGLKPQQAREVLPLATKSEIIMTGFESDWKHFFKLRSSIAETGEPHPDMAALVNPLLWAFIEKGFVKNITLRNL